MFDDFELKQQICNFVTANGFIGAVPDALNLLALGGSDRRFYRVPTDKLSCIAMVTPPPGDEQQAWLDINRFLQSCSIKVPDIYAQDDARHIILVEDAGDVSLYHALQAESEPQARLKLYKQALDVLAAMQVRATPNIQSCACLRTRRFDYTAFRGETDYFTRSFLNEYCRMETPSEIAEEFHRLALTLAKEPPVFMHRDFQSQNIHLVNGRTLIIDFQTATAGPPHYDLVSLLKDAYVVLSKTERNHLLQYYLEARTKLESPVNDQAAFTQTFHLCGLQRNMQALAAFSFLGTHKNKTHFYKHIPVALSYLNEVLSATDDYPCLRTIIAEASKQIKTLPKS